MKFIDSHCHLDFEPLSGDIEGAIERAGRAGVTKMINIGTSLHRSRRSVEIAEFYPSVWASVGLHPQDAGELEEIGTAINELKVMAKSERVVAIGEIGLDYYSSIENPVSSLVKKKQKELFIKQLELANELKLPVIIHVRDAWEDFFTIISNLEFRISNSPKAVLHCFTGDEKIAGKLLDMGFYIGFTGFVTFEQSKFDNIREALKATPLPKILIETDAPFLAPEPYRGKNNEPAYVIEVAKKIATIKGVSLEEVAETTTKNAEKLFNI
jgi:TatD DNase family protein